jgi:hypothetical protein
MSGLFFVGEVVGTVGAAELEFVEKGEQVVVQVTFL